MLFGAGVEAFMVCQSCCEVYCVRLVVWCLCVLSEGVAVLPFGSRRAPRIAGSGGFWRFGGRDGGARIRVFGI